MAVHEAHSYASLAAGPAAGDVVRRASRDPGLPAQDTGRCRTRDDEGGSVTLTSTSEDRRESDPAR
jgi:hypothetical protein